MYNIYIFYRRQPTKVIAEKIRKFFDQRYQLQALLIEFADELAIIRARFPDFYAVVFLISY